MTTPPHVTESLLAGLGAGASFRDALIGDLAEEFALRVDRDGARSARRWYHREAIRTAPHLVRDWLRGKRWRGVTHVVGVALSSYTMLLMLGGLIAAVAISVARAVGISASVSHYLPWNSRLLLLVGAPILALVTTIPGGYIAAWLDSTAPLVSAFALGVLMASANVAAGALGTGVPVWYRVVTPLLVIAGTLAGGMLRVTRVTRVTPVTGTSGIERDRPSAAP